jgi:hypothetical protein
VCGLPRGTQVWRCRYRRLGLWQLTFLRVDRARGQGPSNGEQFGKGQSRVAWRDCVCVSCFALLGQFGAWLVRALVWPPSAKSLLASRLESVFPAVQTKRSKHLLEKDSLIAIVTAGLEPVSKCDHDNVLHGSPVSLHAVLLYPPSDSSSSVQKSVQTAPCVL